MRPKQQNQVKSTHSKIVKGKLPAADLGETDTTTSIEDVLSPDGEDSFSAPTDNEGTDYGLEFTTPATYHEVDSAKGMAPIQVVKAITKIVPPSKDPSGSQITATAGISKRVAQKQQVQKRKKQKDLQNLKEYEKLTARVDYMIPRAAFGRVVREIMSSLGTDVQYIGTTALEALQTATEAYVSGRLEDAHLLALHARRSTLMAKDMELLNFLSINLK